MVYLLIITNWLPSVAILISMVANLQSQHGNTVPLCKPGNLPDVPQAEATVTTRYKRCSS